MFRCTPPQLKAVLRFQKRKTHLKSRGVSLTLILVLKITIEELLNQTAKAFDQAVLTKTIES